MTESLYDNKDLTNKNSEPQLKGQHKKYRRKRVESDGRNYICVCGKSYLSYPALYTHVKIKHNGDASLSQKVSVNALQTQPQAQHKQPQNLNLNRFDRMSKCKSEQESSDIQKLKQFLYKQFFKDKSKDFLLQMKNSLILIQEQISYINQIMKLVQQNQNKRFEVQSRYFNSNHKSQCLASDNKQKENQMMMAIQNSPQLRKHQKLNILRNFMEKSQKENNKQGRIQSHGFKSYIKPNQQFLKRNNKTDEIVIDEIFGIFLSGFNHSNAHSQFINMIMSYFVCKIKQFFDKKFQSKFTSEKLCQSLTQESNEIFDHLLQVQNPYLRQPITVCKILFYFYRWMFSQRFTNQFVKFNEVGIFVG